MLFVILGVILLVMNWTGVGPPAQWNFDVFGDMWKFAWPFLAAVIWWSWSDATGRTQRKAMDRMEQRKVDRRERALDALGLGTRGRKAKRQENTASSGSEHAARSGAENMAASQDRDMGRRKDPRL